MKKLEIRFESREIKDGFTIESSGYKFYCVGNASEVKKIISDVRKLTNKYNDICVTLLVDAKKVYKRLIKDYDITVISWEYWKENNYYSCDKADIKQEEINKTISAIVKDAVNNCEGTIDID